MLLSRLVRLPRLAAEPLQKNPFWGCVGLATGIVLTVAVTKFHDIRPLLWPALFILVSPAQMLIWAAVKSLWQRIIMLALIMLLLFAGICWLYFHVPPEVEMPMEATYTSKGVFPGLHATLTAGDCQGGIPEASRKIQWTWFLSGSHFDCESNEYKSRATIRFESGSLGSVDTHAEDLLYHGEPVHATISWYTTRGDGNVKWVLSAACADSRVLQSLDYKDVLSVLDSPEKTGVRFQKTSAGSFQVGGDCSFSSGVFLRLARHGNEKEDTLQAAVYVTELQIDSVGPGNVLRNPN